MYSYFDSKRRRLKRGERHDRATIKVQATKRRSDTRQDNVISERSGRTAARERLQPYALSLERTAAGQTLEEVPLERRGCAVLSIAARHKIGDAPDAVRRVAHCNCKPGELKHLNIILRAAVETRGRGEHASV